jgi:hypothetical protein
MNSVSVKVFLYAIAGVFNKINFCLVLRCICVRKMGYICKVSNYVFGNFFSEVGFFPNFMLYSRKSLQ